MGAYSPAVAHHVGCNDAQAKVQQERDLVSPAEGEVGPAVDLDGRC